MKARKTLAGGSPATARLRGTPGNTPRGRGTPRKMAFSDEFQTCAICCDDVPANSAVRLACRHGWYCADCIRRDADAQLERGCVDIRCPECREPIQEHDFKKLLKKDVIQRLHALSIKQAIACSANIRPCPTADCSYAVELEDDEEPRLSKCPLCKKSSCLVCGVQPYHKGITCAEFQATRTQNNKHEKLLQRWMTKTGTQQCPCCRAAISKESLMEQTSQRRECHKMMCYFCKTKFCFKCNKILTDTFTCGCSSSIHGMIDPRSGKRLEHKAVLKVHKVKVPVKAVRPPTDGRRSSVTRR